LLTSKVPLRDEKGRITGIVGIALDISERKQLEQALQRERILLRTLIDLLPDAVYVKDTESRKILVNKAEVASMGFQTEAEALGKNDFDVYPPEIAAQFQADDLRVLRHGESVFDREEISTGQDGRQRWLLTSKMPLRDEQGQIVGLVGVGHNITARKQAELALRQSEEHFRSLIENTSDIIAEVTADALISYLSPSVERVLGYKPADLIGQNILDLVHPEDVERAMLALGRAAQAGGALVVETLRIKNHDGSWHTIEAAGRLEQRQGAEPEIIGSM